MRITYITIFPQITTSFVQTSLIRRAIEDDLLQIDCIDPRDFCTDKHRQVDDEIYGGGPGLLIKAPPVIDAITTAIGEQSGQSTATYRIVFVRPAPTIFGQQCASELAQIDHLIFVCGRYEGIDVRAEQYCRTHYPQQTIALSLGTFVTMGGELPAMTMTEAITRLIPGVLHDLHSTHHESHSIQMGDDYLEHPQYTRPEHVHGMSVPETLLSGNHAAIDQRKQTNSTTLTEG